MKKFVSGILVGSLATAAAVAGLVASVKKTVIDPIDEKETMIEENRKKQCANAFLVNNYLKTRMKTCERTDKSSCVFLFVSQYKLCYFICLSQIPWICIRSSYCCS